MEQPPGQDDQHPLDHVQDFVGEAVLPTPKQPHHQEDGDHHIHDNLEIILWAIENQEIQYQRVEDDSNLASTTVEDEAFHQQSKTEMMHDNQPVISRLDGKTLAQMAVETGGAYVPAGTSALDLESIVKKNITPILRAEADAATRVIPAEQYPWMVLIALIALVGSVAAGSWRRP